jgi:carboxyl-terminal processing protease
MKERLKKKFKSIFKTKKRKKFGITEVIVIFASTLLLSLVFGLFLGYRFSNNKQVSEYSKELQDFIKNYQYIVENYYGELNEETLTDEAIKSILESLGDPFSNFIDPEDTNFEIRLDGSFRGIGVEIRSDEEGNVRIDGIFDESPAKKAGFEIGDVIISVDGKDFLGKLPTEVSLYVKQSEKEMTFVVLRNGEEKTLKLSKGLVIITSVYSDIINVDDQKIGYLKVDIFSATTYNQFKRELESLEKSNIDSLIIDFRNNSGGHLSVVRDMMSLFLKKDKIMYQTENKDSIEKFYSKGNKEKNYEIVFLSNSATASASEVMIAALKDNLGSKLVGETTFGKGTVQELQSLPDGTKYKLTVKKWLTPNGIWIDKIGIEPDYEVSLDENYINNPTSDNDNQLQKAIDILSK